MILKNKHCSVELPDEFQILINRIKNTMQECTHSNLTFWCFTVIYLQSFVVARVQIEIACD